jgi:hypothetical protein
MDYLLVSEKMRQYIKRSHADKVAIDSNGTFAQFVSAVEVWKHK